MKFLRLYVIKYLKNGKIWCFEIYRIDCYLKLHQILKEMKFWKLDILEYCYIIWFEYCFIYDQLKETEFWDFIEFSFPDIKYCDLYRYV